jgi:hypothetical protein
MFIKVRLTSDAKLEDVDTLDIETGTVPERLVRNRLPSLTYLELA